MNSARHAPLIALLSAAAFGLSTPLAKLLLGDVSPWVLAALLYLGSGFGLIIVYAWRKIWAEAEPGVQRSDVIWLLGAVLFGGVLGPVLLLSGLNRSDAASASLLLNLESVFTLVLAWAVFREHVDRRLFVGATAIILAAGLIYWRGSLGSGNFGSLLIGAACLCWAIDNNFTRNISAADPFLLAAVKGLVAGSINLALALSVGARLPHISTIISGMALGFVSYGLGLVLFIFALRHLGTARTGAYYGTAPFIGALFAVAVMGEPVTITLVVAGGLMLLGVWLHLSEQHIHEHDHEMLEHDHSHVHDSHHQHHHDSNVPLSEPHTHPHRHAPLRHAHTHWPDQHHRHGHS